MGFPFFFMLFIFSECVLAIIHVENHSEHTFRISFHGEPCRLFDGDKYDYAPCEERVIAPNSCSTFFENVQGEHDLSAKTRLVFPRILFHWYGFSYICKLTKKQSDSHNPNEHAEEPPLPRYLKLGGQGLVLTRNYKMTVESTYGYFPQPYSDCQISETPSCVSQ